MISKEILAKIEKYDQKQLLRYYDEISEDEKKVFERELEELDFTYLDIYKIAGENAKKESVYEPIAAMKLGEINENKEAYEKIGIEAIKDTKVAAILLAGGQGSRLGFDKPKGMFNIGITKDVFIFERLISNLLEVVNKAGCYIPLFIMTSEKNDSDTRAFFEEKNYFGYDKNFVHFFVQEMAPSIDYNGKFLMESKYKLSLSPNGNGGWFKSLMNSDVSDKFNEYGIEWLNVFAVDNVLQRIADPVFIGATIDSKKPSGAKVVRKASPDERVGVVCKENNRPSIVEYYELTKEMMEKKDESGEPAYNYGVILNYLFNFKELCNIMNNKLTNHMAEKKITYIDDNGNVITPESPNGYKFETLILDMINMLDDCLVFEVERNKEFAPIKNKTGVDSIDSARALLKENDIEL
ncbi:UDP-N-acetylglucosamine/UDP-N-acetylgalactosaminediphosphorylase [Lachnospiraceae bacterium RM5]|nr:UDP-N-acetylglucosamine/UDP-N-acetylgalactosaminediphosphorylase [Lachnospiraceae bacterium RM5]